MDNSSQAQLLTQKPAKKLLVVFRVKRKRTISEIQEEYFSKGLTTKKHTKQKDISTKEDIKRRFENEKKRRKKKVYRKMQSLTTEEVFAEFESVREEASTFGLTLRKELQKLGRGKKQRFHLLKNELYLRDPETHNF